MKQILRSLLLALLLLPVQHALADEMKFGLTGHAGSASISNFSAFSNSRYLRLSGNLDVNEMLSFSLFGTRYSGFTSGGANPTEVKLTASGIGATGTWPLHPHLLPYLRVEYMKWSLSSYGFGRTLASENGGSLGMAAGLRLPVSESAAFLIETSGYNKVSDANIRQYALGLTLTF